MIELNKLTYNSNVAALSVASQGIKKVRRQPEIYWKYENLVAIFRNLSDFIGTVWKL